jgi:hypothetical protein
VVLFLRSSLATCFNLGLYRNIRFRAISKNPFDFLNSILFKTGYQKTLYPGKIFPALISPQINFYSSNYPPSKPKVHRLSATPTQTHNAHSPFEGGRCRRSRYQGDVRPLSNTSPGFCRRQNHPPSKGDFFKACGLICFFKGGIF